ncbi:MAG: homoserine kinase [Sphingobacteriales bacterium]|nr:MAG: homoserine kinase [Sphingobacteriales bacterium]
MIKHTSSYGLKACWIALRHVLPDCSSARIDGHQYFQPVGRIEFNYFIRMDTFPVITSVLSPEHLTSWVAAQYGFRNATCRLLKTNMNDSYLITAEEGRFVLRVYNQKHRTFKQVSEEVRLLLLLKEQGVAVSYPVANRDGRFILEVQAPEGVRLLVLFSFAEGDKIRYLSPEMSRSIGVLMGQLHAATAAVKTTRIRYSAEVLAGWAYTQVRQHFGNCKAELSFMKACEAMLQKAFSNPALRTGIVHLDIWYDNMSIHTDGTVTLFDFDNCGTGLLVLDLGYYCMQLYQIESDKTIYEKKKQHFIEGYCSVMPVSDEELKLIPLAGLAVWIYYLGVQTERYDSFGNRFLSANYIKMFLGRAQDWLVHNKVVVESGTTVASSE